MNSFDKKKGKKMQSIYNKDEERILDVLEKKYSFNCFPSRISLNTPMLAFNRKLTVSELNEGLEQLKRTDLPYYYGIDIEKSFKTLVPTKKLSVLFAFLYNWLAVLLLIATICVFVFLDWRTGVFILILSIFELFSPFSKNLLKKIIFKIALKDHEAFYMLLCVEALTIKFE